MICTALESIGLSTINLVHGDCYIEPARNVEIDICELGLFHRGREASINNMLKHGNGFANPPADLNTVDITMFNHGVVAERRDFRSMRVWENSYAQCHSDKTKGATA